MRDYDKLRKGYNREVLEEYLSDLSFRSALDIGCGTGELSFLLREFCSEVTGADINQEYIKMARHKVKSKHVEFIHCSAEEFSSPFKYDLIATAQSYMYFDKEKFFEMADRQLSSDGSIIVLWKYPIMPSWLVSYLRSKDLNTDRMDLDLQQKSVEHAVSQISEGFKLDSSSVLTGSYHYTNKELAYYSLWSFKDYLHLADEIKDLAVKNKFHGELEFKHFVFRLVRS